MVESAAASALEVTTLTAGKKVIPLVATQGGIELTNVKLPDLVVKNTAASPVTLRQLVVVGRSGDAEVVRYEFSAETVARAVAEAGKKLNEALADRGNEVRMATALGVLASRGPFVEGPTLGPGGLAVLRLSRLAFLEYAGPAPLSGLEIHVMAEADGGDLTAGGLAFALDAHRNRGDYVFPLAKTNLLVANMPANLPQHRRQHSQEFAFDVVGIGMDRSGVLNTSNGAPAALADYFIFHKEVRAIGAGRVVATGNAFPEARMANPKEYNEPFFEALLAELEPSIGFLNVIGGNYLVIDHENGEYSAYMHLSEGTLQKQVGDRVERGETIALVGNTGHSTEPHLHFQLMDGPDFLAANGLPVMFADVKPQEMSQNLAAANSLYTSDYLPFNELPAQ